MIFREEEIAEPCIRELSSLQNTTAILINIQVGNKPTEHRSILHKSIMLWTAAWHYPLGSQTRRKATLELVYQSWEEPENLQVLHGYSIESS